MGEISIIAGLSGTGKTELSQEKMKSLAAQGKRIIVFVPDQFSFETERRLYSVIGARGISAVKVTSFSRIAREILTEYRLVKPYADDVVKQITMLRAVKSLGGSLTYYRRGTAKTGFVKKLLKTVASLKNAGYTPKTFTSELNSENAPKGALLEKMSDLSLIFSAYDELLTKALDDKLDDVSKAAEAALKHGYFNGAVCFFDNFDTFSKVQQRLLEVIFMQCESSALCLTTDAENSRDRRFFCINKTIDALKALSDGITFTLCKEPYRAKMLSNPSVKCFECENPYEEARYIAAEIKNTVMSEGARYRDFLVLTADRAYAGAVTDKLFEYSIPSFSDFPQPFTAKPAVSFVLTILKALSFETEDLLRYFESGFVRADNGKGVCTTLKSNRVDALKKAAAKYLLIRENWLNEFTDSAEIKLSALEPLRKELIGQLLELKKMLEEAADGAQMTAVFVNFLMNVQHLNATFIGNSKAGSGGFTEELVLDAQTSAEYQRIWETLTEVFDSMAYCLSAVKMGISDFYDTLSSVLSDLTLANPPKVLDCVTVGDLERSRKASPKYVFICGMNEGAIPRKTSFQSVLTAAEVEKLHENGIEIGDARLTRWSKELYFTYRAVSAPEKRLIITFSKRSFSGAEQLPSAYIENELKIKPESAAQLPPEFFAATEASVKSMLAKSFGDETLKNALVTALGSKNDYVALLNNAAAFAQGNLKNVKMSPEFAERLFDMTKYSPTALETMFGCPFSFFCKYGLKIRSEDGQDIDDAREVGNAVHVAMQTAIGTYLDGENGGFESFKALDKDGLAALAEQSLKTAEEKYLSRSKSDKNRVHIFIEALKPRIKMLLLQLQTDLKETMFVPAATEQEVCFALDKNTSVVGIADRIDKRQTENGELIRICDYKTGSKKLDLNAAASGSGLQMFLYLFAQDKSGAVQYVSAKGGSASRSVRGGENDAQSWLDSHRVSGAYTGAELSDSYKSLNKAYCAEAGAGDRTQFVKMEELSEEDYERFKNYCTRTLIGGKIASVKSGEVPALPLNFGSNKTACGYCDFKYICGNKNGVFGLNEISDNAFSDALKATDENTKGGAVNNG